MKNIHFLLSLIMFVACSCSYLQSQPPGYSIQLTITNSSALDDELYLGFYYNGRTYLADTAQLTGSGVYLFESASITLKRGFYFFMNAEKRPLFDFVVGSDQRFELVSDAEGADRVISSKGDKENTIFLKITEQSKSSYLRAKPYMAIAEDSLQSKEAREEANEELRKIQTAAKEDKNKLIEKYPESIAAIYLRSIDPVVVPKDLSGGENDSLYRYFYYKSHFFDNFKLTDSVVLRFPQKDFLKDKLKEYLNEVVEPVADSIIAAITHLEERTQGNQNVLQQIVWIATIDFQKPSIMGLDKVFVHLYDTYYATGIMDSLANKPLRENIKTEADFKRLSLLGNIGPNLAMQDQSLNVKSLYELQNKYKLLYFFDPDCHACSKETPKVADFVSNTDFDIGVYAICTDTSMVKMKEYVIKHKLDNWTVVSGPRTLVGPYHKLYDARSTPTIIMLNESNRIIAKKIGAKDLASFLGNHERINSSK